MATDIRICSAALLQLGQRPIASFSEGSKAALLCANLYPLARRELLRMHPWNCATLRVILAPLADAPAFGWSRQFARPGDWLRTLQVGETGCPEEYETEGGRIMANTSVLKLRYVAEVNETQWDANLTDLAIKRMAKDLAYPVTKSTSLAQLKTAEYEQALKIAKAIDGQENPPEDWSDSPFIQVRG